jgi:transcriptional regulator with XRE-family HTH domain
VDNRQEVREFLVSRRAKITPEQAGLRSGANRRVPGLRRGEVAAVAGVSIEYYSKLERGALAGVSAGVLDAVARALQLDEAERAYLFDLALAADGTIAVVRPRRRSKGKRWTPHQSLRWTLDAITAGPAFVRNGRMDLLAGNQLARAFYSPVHENRQQSPNIARFQFLDPASHEFYPDWDAFADVCVAILRTEAGRNPHDKELHDLIGELSTRSDEFRTRWGAHDVRHHGTGTKTFHHPVVGDLTLAYEGLEMAAEPGLTLTIYTAEPGSASEVGLRLLASWAASQEAEQESVPRHLFG